MLPDNTLHHFFSLKLADRAAVDFFYPLKYCIHLSESHLSQAQGARKPSAYHRQQLSGRSEVAEVLQARTVVRRQICGWTVVCVRSDCVVLALTVLLSQMLKPVTAK